MNHVQRLKRLETAYFRYIVAPEAAKYGIDPDELLEEVRRFLALTDAEQDAELAPAHQKWTRAHMDLTHFW
jgi:hypothetical protein